jgi:hypothetical protein
VWQVFSLSAIVADRTRLATYCLSCFENQSGPFDPITFSLLRPETGAEDEDGYF